MSNDEFIKLIESIGFKYNGSSYRYKEYSIIWYRVHYEFCDGSEWNDGYYYTNLTPIKYHFKNELRSIKLKELLR